ncbi:MAG: hypothetical protein LBR33_09450 [Propionibacteriaceae bacterium]|jgi:hypothetical protein|nr:hypothetical protein [Propionibacteriaceae bacterium]
MNRRSRTRRTGLGVTLALLATAGPILAGCARPDDPCPAAVDAAVIWSAGQRRDSRVQWVAGGAVAAETSIKAQNVTRSPQTPVYLDGDAVVGFDGSDADDRHGAVILNSSTCQATVVQAGQKGVLDVTATADGFVFTNTINAAGRLQRHSADGELLAEAQMEGYVISALVADGDNLYVFASTLPTVTLTDDAAPPPEASIVSVRRLDDLSEVAQVTLPPGNSGILSAFAAGGQVYFPLEGGLLGSLDEASLAVDTVALGYAGPEFVRVVGNFAYVAHGSPSEFLRHISVVDLATRAVRGVDLTYPIEVVDANDTTLAAVGQRSDGVYILHTYSLPDLTEQAVIELTPPTDADFVYLANVILPR